MNYPCAYCMACSVFVKRRSFPRSHSQSLHSRQWTHFTVTNVHTANLICWVERCTSIESALQYSPGKWNFSAQDITNSTWSSLWMISVRHRMYPCNWNGIYYLTGIHILYYIDHGYLFVSFLWYSLFETVPELFHIFNDLRTFFSGLVT